MQKVVAERWLSTVQLLPMLRVNRRMEKKREAMNRFAKTMIKGVATAAVVTRKAMELFERDAYSFKGKVVLITGARGLALVLARMLATEGALLTLVARDPLELERAETELRALNGTVHTVTADLRNPDEAEAAVQSALATYGKLDVLINNAGVIQGGPLEHMSRQDYEDALAIHFWAPLYTMQSAVPHMKQRRAGRIVNIASIGGLVAVPHLAPYSASKFALVGLSDAWRDELAKDGIQITTVCPGLMRTGSQYNTGIKGQHEKEFSLFSILISSPLASIDERKAARQIIEACRRGNARLIISVQAQLLALADALLPELTADLKAFAVRFLPGPTDPSGDRLQTGWQSRSPLAPSLLTRWIDDAAARNNELNSCCSLWSFFVFFVPSPGAPTVGVVRCKPYPSSVTSAPTLRRPATLRGRRAGAVRHAASGRCQFSSRSGRHGAGKSP